MSDGSQSINVELDPFMEFNQSNPSPTIINNQALNFTIPQLRPFECTTIRIEYLLSCDADLGQEHCINTTLENSQNCIADSDSILEEICAVNVGSFDPNDMNAIIDNKMNSEHTVSPGLTETEYLIRFQNSGTDTAFNVSIEAHFSELNNLEDIVVSDFSHQYSYCMTDSNSLIIKFDNILLPYEDIDEAGSNGHIKFKLQTTSPLQVGNELTAVSDIFFDFNDPIITNEVHIDVSTLSSNQDIESEEYIILPNPSSGILKITSKNDNLPQSIKVYDIAGHCHYSNRSRGQIDLGFLANGLYLIHIESSDSRSIHKWIKQ